MKINTVTVVGAGYMGGSIAQVMAMEGMPVRIADVDVQTANEALERLKKEAVEFEEQGLFPKGSAEKIKKNLSAGLTIAEAVQDVDFIEEAVFERVDVKHDVLKEISKHARLDAIIGSNTSTIPVHELAPAVNNPERFLTVHFSNPGILIPGVELVAGKATSQEVIDSVKELLVRVGREGAQVADTPGFVLNRLQYALLKEATMIVEEGVATMEDLDTIVRTTFGFRLGFFGPFAIAEQAGLDVYANCFVTFEDAYGERLSTPKMLTGAVAEGKKGVKNGRGMLGNYDNETREALVAYRNKAYARMNQLIAELGPAPKPTK